MASRYGGNAPISTSEAAYDDEDLKKERPKLAAITAVLTNGTTITKLPSKPKGRPEQKTFRLNVGEFKISWFRGASGKEEGSSK